MNLLYDKDEDVAHEPIKPDSFFEREALKAWLKWTEKYNWTWYVTFTCKNAFSRKKASNQLHRFMYEKGITLMTHKEFKKVGLPFVGAFEKVAESDHGYHIHVLLNNVFDTFFIKYWWRSLQEDANISVNIQPFTSSVDLMVYINKDEDLVDNLPIRPYKPRVAKVKISS